MARGKRGGKRQPANPAPVSAPGSGARTDGGAGSKSQPLRLASDQPYGDRAAMVEQQSGAPMAVADTASAGMGIPAEGGPGGPASSMGVFGPTTRPNESPLAGLSPDTGEVLDAQTVLRLLYRKRPSPWLARLINNG